MFDKVGQFGAKGAAAARLAMLQRRITSHKVVHEDKGVKVVVTGDGKIKRIEQNGEELKEVSKVVNEAIDKARKWAEGETRGMMGDLAKLFK